MTDERPALPWGNLLTAMVTPFASDGSLDLVAAAAVARHAVDSGCDGVVVSGTTGESPTTTDAEKDDLLRAVVREVGDRASVVAGVGSNDTRHAVELACRAAAAGVDGLLVVTPYYSRPPDAGVLDHFRQVADATALPVMLYDIPGRTGLRLSRDVLVAAARHPRIVAVKDATGDLDAGAEVMAETGLAYYSGDDTLNLPWLAVGAAGLVSTVAQVTPGPLAELVTAIRVSDLPKARSLAQRVRPVVHAIMNLTQGAIMAKAGLELLGVLPGRTTRPPLPPARPDEVDALRRALATAGLAADDALVPTGAAR